jgi:hypothetical protein
MITNKPSILIAVLISLVLVNGAPVVVSGGPDNDYESWIVRLKDGRLMVIFDRNPDWASGDLYVSFSTDDGNTWSPVSPIIVDAGDQATLSFQQLPGDTIRVWYASNEAGNYAIYSAYSMDGLNWTREGVVNLGWSSSTMYFDPTVILEPDSSLTMSYRVQSTGGYVAHCPRSGTWDTLKTLAAPAAFRPRIMRHSNGTYLYAYHRRSGPNSTNYDVFIRTSTNRINWSDSVRLTFNLNSHDPFAFQAADSGYLVYYGKYQNPAYNLHRRLSYDAVNWQPEEQITFDAVNNLQPHFFTESRQIYMVWAHAIDYATNNDVYFEKTSDIGIKERTAADNAGTTLQVTPNPFRKKTAVFFCIGQSAKSKGNNTHSPMPSALCLKIYDATGRPVKSFFYSMPSAHMPINIIWQGDDDQGCALPPGVYFYRIETGQVAVTRKIVLLE